MAPIRWNNRPRARRFPRGGRASADNLDQLRRADKPFAVADVLAEPLRRQQRRNGALDAQQIEAPRRHVADHSTARGGSILGTAFDSASDQLAGPFRHHPHELLLSSYRCEPRQLGHVRPAHRVAGEYPFAEQLVECPTQSRRPIRSAACPFIAVVFRQLRWIHSAVTLARAVIKQGRVLGFPLERTLDAQPRLFDGPLAGSFAGAVGFTLAEPFRRLLRLQQKLCAEQHGPLVESRIDGKLIRQRALGRCP